MPTVGVLLIGMDLQPSLELYSLICAYNRASLLAWLIESTVLKSESGFDLAEECLGVCHVVPKPSRHGGRETHCGKIKRQTSSG